MVHNESGKPVVVFGYESVSFPAKVGQRAYLLDVEDHPLLGNQRYVSTSTVLDIRDDGRTIETRNTIYIKKE